MARSGVSTGTQSTDWMFCVTTLSASFRRSSRSAFDFRTDVRPR